ncbi:MAG TPA: hypothetical protein VGA66_10320 [Mycobacterium sp.]
MTINILADPSGKSPHYVVWFKPTGVYLPVLIGKGDTYAAAMRDATQELVGALCALGEQMEASDD